MFGISQGWLMNIVILAPVILFAVTIHEVAHGYMALRKGDPTAKMAGRLTLNPLKHLDLFGTLAFVVTGMIGWAKPVPIDARYFKNPRRDMIWVSLAGPAANLAAAFVFAQIIRVLYYPTFSQDEAFIVELLFRVVVINVGLAVFNLLPIPPLDGSHVLEGLLPPRAAMSYARLAPYGIFILLGLVFLGWTGNIIRPIMTAILHFLFS